MRPTWSLFMGLAVAVGLAGSVAQAGWELPSIINTNMVLQRETDAPLWGWDEPGTKVTVSFRGQEVTTEAGTDGKWQVRMPTGKAGGAFVLRIKGTREVTIEGVLVGEVWVAGGQSNMWQHEFNCKNAEQEQADADYPMIRIWDANTSLTQGGWGTHTPQRTVKAEWTLVAPGSISNLPAVPFFFARDLYKALKVPIGIVHLAVPGQAIETFLSPTFIKANSSFLEKQVDPKRPAPSCFYNGMVTPAAPYAMRGFVWWQGEGNAGASLQYRVLFTGLIEDWRRTWDKPDAPFLFVELANFLKAQTQPVEDDWWPALRDAQNHALALEHVHGVSAIDAFGLAESADNIHPPDKKPTGHRLALAALANVYGEKRLVWSGPRFKSAQFDGTKVIISFEHVGGGLTARGDGKLRGFALAGADRRFYWADARLVRNTVVLTSTNVPAPVAVRYAWANNPIGTLINKEGLPAFPFRTDHWNLLEK